MERTPRAFASARPQLQTLALPLASCMAPNAGKRGLLSGRQGVFTARMQVPDLPSYLRCLALPQICSVSFAGYLTLQDLIASSSKIGPIMVTCHEKVGAGLGPVLGTQ